MNDNGLLSMQSGCVKRARSEAEDGRRDAEHEAGGPGLQIEGVRGHGPPVFCNAMESASLSQMDFAFVHRVGGHHRAAPRSF